jgi:hypothetical protein
MSDIHSIAERFLRDLARGTAYSADPVPIEPLAVYSKGLDIVALRREEKPQFFAGFKPSGRPVFTHDLRLAQSYSATSIKLHETVGRLAVIGTEVLPHATVWFDGKHITEHA